MIEKKTKKEEEEETKSITKFFIHFVRKIITY